MYADTVRLYRICSACITETMLKLEQLPLEHIKLLATNLAEFLKLTEELQKSVTSMFNQLGENLTPIINFFKVQIRSSRRETMLS